MKRHYWSRFKQMGTYSWDIVLKPFDDLVDYVVKAWNYGLDKKEECAYAGLKLLYSALDATERRFTSNVAEANELFTAGMEVANYLWDELDRLKGDLLNFKANVDDIAKMLYKEFLNMG